MFGPGFGAKAVVLKDRFAGPNSLYSDDHPCARTPPRPRPPRAKQGASPFVGSPLTGLMDAGAAEDEPPQLSELDQLHALGDKKFGKPRFRKADPFALNGKGSSCVDLAHANAALKRKFRDGLKVPSANPVGAHGRCTAIIINVAAALSQFHKYE